MIPQSLSANKNLHTAWGYTKSFRKSVCNCVWLPDVIKGFILNAHPDFLHKVDDIIKMIYELKREEYKIQLNKNEVLPENNKENLDFYDNLLKEQRFASYNTLELLVKSSEGEDYEFRREFKLFCDTFNIKSYLILEEPRHTEKCTNNCVPIYPLYISSRYQRE
jgi:hypothetical protein